MVPRVTAFQAVTAGALAALFVLSWSLTGLTALEAVALVVGGGGAVAGLVLGVRRFEWFVLGVLTVRPLLDALRVEAAGPLTPATLLGLVFLGVGGWWLVRRQLQGLLAPPSALCWSLVGLLAAAAFSVLVSVVLPLSVVGITRLASAVMMFWVLEQMLRTGRLRVTQIIGAVLASAVTVLLYVFWQLVSGTAPIDEFTGIARVVGPFVHPSVLAKYAALLLVGAVSWAIWTNGRVRLIALAVAPLLALTVALTYTRGAWAAAVIGVAVLLARWDWRALAVSMAGMATAVLTVPAFYDRVAEIWREPEVELPGAPDNSLQWRLGYWEDLVPMARVSPVNGMGLDTVPVLGGIDLAAHNIWVQAYVEMGWVGLGALGVVAASTAVMVHRVARTATSLTGTHRAAVEGAIAGAWCLLLMTPTENLLSETTTLWYGAVLLLCGLTRSGVSWERRDADHASKGDGLLGQGRDQAQARP